MNFVFLHRIWPLFGGGERVTQGLANELVRRGHQVHVLFFKKSESQVTSVELGNRVVERLIPNVQLEETSSEFFINRREANRVSNYTVSYIKEHEIDVVVNQWWPVEYLKGVSVSTNAKVIKCLHINPDTKRDFSNFTGVGKRMLRMLEPAYRMIERKKHIYSCDKYVKNSDLLLFLSSSYVDFYLKNTKLKNIDGKVDFICNPSSFGKSDVDFSRKSKTVLVVSRLEEKPKQLSKVLKVWKMLDKKHTEEWNLKIVGDGPDREYYEHYIKEQNLSNVSLEGFQDPLPYYAEASIFLMTSAYEGWGMTLVEAQQMGVVPIVMNTYQALHDIVQNRENGIITTTDLEEYRCALVECMDNIPFRNEMAKNAQESAQRFSVEKVVDRWEFVLNELVQS